MCNDFPCTPCSREDSHYHINHRSTTFQYMAVFDFGEYPKYTWAIYLDHAPKLWKPEQDRTEDTTACRSNSEKACMGNVVQQGSM